MPPPFGMNGDSGGDATDKNTATGRSRAPRSMRRITRRPAGRRMNRRGRGVAEAWPRRGRGVAEAKGLGPGQRASISSIGGSGACIE